MRKRLLLLSLALIPVFGQTARAEEIVTWKDADGVTHFGNPQLAPVDAEAVDVAPANGMAVPEPPASTQGSSSPTMVLLEKKKNRETIGWRGHEWNVARRPRR